MGLDAGREVRRGLQKARKALGTFCINPCGLCLRQPWRTARVVFLSCKGLLAAKRHLAAHPDLRSTVPPELCRAPLAGGRQLIDAAHLALVVMVHHHLLRLLPLPQLLCGHVGVLRQAVRAYLPSHSSANTQRLPPTQKSYRQHEKKNNATHPRIAY